MSLQPCPSCENQVSTEADTCPKCGHRFHYAGGLNMKDPVHVLGVLICIALVIGAVMYIQMVSGAQ